MKIAYLMNVDWNWIKQRPHFIAEELSKNNNITVFFQKRYLQKGYQKRSYNHMNIIPLYVIPRGDRYRFLRKVNIIIKKNIIMKYAKKYDFDWVYTTYPDQIDLIREFQGKIVYDCMDNHPAFISNDESKKEELIKQEKELVTKADKIFCSSEKLKQVLLECYGYHLENKITVVRNGYDGKIIDKSTIKLNKMKNRYILSYFGTISSWFNFEFIKKSLEDFPEIEYHLYGPVAGTQIPNSSRIKYFGTVEHDKLYSAVSDSDCFIMPFILNDLIQAVDPVKLYEYINFNRNILCVYYKEIERFDPFVFFYNSYDSYKKQIESLLHLKTIKYSDIQRINFLKDNNWSQRVKQIQKNLI